MSGSIFIKESVILDACVVINLYASGHMRLILSSIPCKVTMSKYVREKEALTTVGHPSGDLQDFIDCGLITLVEPEFEQEAEDVINLVFSKLDEGEAYTGAIGVYRNWTIATDEKLATKIFMGMSSKPHILTTLDIVKHWSESTNVPTNDVVSVLEDIRQYGSYVPGKNHPLYVWWKRFVP